MIRKLNILIVLYILQKKHEDYALLFYTFRLTEQNLFIMIGNVLFCGE